MKIVLYSLINLIISGYSLSVFANTESKNEAEKLVHKVHEDHKAHDDHKADDNQKEHDDHKAHDNHEAHDDHKESDGHKKHEGHGKDEHDSPRGAVSLTPSQIKLANIQTAALRPEFIDYHVYAPAEIKVNGYTSYNVSPRVVSVVIKRHVTLGAHVKKGQLLVTLFSEAMAQAQADYQVSYAEWQRVKKLGRKIIDEKHYLDARTGVQVSYGRLKAMGLSEETIKTISRQKSDLGEYQLTAKIDGSVLSDSFQQGQRVEAGETLIELADEKKLWVEANLPSAKNLPITAGTVADVKVNGQRYLAKVIQESHIIELKTRTRIIRLAIDNTSHQLHPGMFADVFFSLRTEKPVLAVPESALLRNEEGDWVLYLESETGSYKPETVETGRSFGRMREITGLKTNSKIVTNGAFFIKAQNAKSNFDPHNH